MQRTPSLLLLYFFTSGLLVLFIYLFYLFYLYFIFIFIFFLFLWLLLYLCYLQQDIYFTFHLSSFLILPFYSYIHVGFDVGCCCWYGDFPGYNCQSPDLVLGYPWLDFQPWKVLWCDCDFHRAKTRLELICRQGRESIVPRLFRSRARGHYTLRPWFWETGKTSGERLRTWCTSIMQSYRR